jgi:hypothetical protein
LNNALSAILANCHLAKAGVVPSNPAWRELEEIEASAFRAVALLRAISSLK